MPTCLILIDFEVIVYSFSLNSHLPYLLIWRWFWMLQATWLQLKLGEDHGSTPGKARLLHQSLFALLFRFLLMKMRYLVWLHFLSPLACSCLVSPSLLLFFDELSSDLWIITREGSGPIWYPTQKSHCDRD